MTPAEIIAMANEAAAQHGHTYEPESADGTIEILGSFAALVAEKAAARATEACAVLALDKAGATAYDYSTCINIANAIRARGAQ
jgi:hypothetical protein